MPEEPNKVKLTLMNTSPGLRVLYDASGQAKEIPPGFAAEVEMMEPVAKQFQERSQWDDLKVAEGEMLQKAQEAGRVIGSTSATATPVGAETTSGAAVGGVTRPSGGGGGVARAPQGETTGDPLSSAGAPSGADKTAKAREAAAAKRLQAQEENARKLREAQEEEARTADEAAREVGGEQDANNAERQGQ